MSEPLKRYHIEAVCDECGGKAGYTYGPAAPTQEALFYLAADVDALLQQREEEITDLKSAVEVIQSSRDILLNTFTLWTVEYQHGKMALREVPDLRIQLAAVTQELEEYRSIAETIGAEKAVSALAQAQQQLAARERAVWLEAAKLADEHECGGADDIICQHQNCASIICGLCIRQAEAVKP